MNWKDILLGSLKSKTQWFNAAAVIVGILADNSEALLSVMGTGAGGKLIAGIGIVNMVLRSLTTQSLKAKVAKRKPRRKGAP